MVSNLATAEEACRLYQKRFRIETFFSDFITGHFLSLN